MQKVKTPTTMRMSNKTKKKHKSQGNQQSGEAQIELHPSQPTSSSDPDFHQNFNKAVKD